MWAIFKLIHWSIILRVMENKIRAMFTNLCCSRCKADFDENSIKVIREEDSMLVVKLFVTSVEKLLAPHF